MPKLKTDGRGRKRNYRHEYDRDHAPAEDRAARGRRNKANAAGKKSGKLKPGQEMHHPAGNAKGKAVPISRKKNRVIGNKARKKK